MVMSLFVENVSNFVIINILWDVALKGCILTIELWMSC